jgi:hypothetical protein
MHSSFLSIESYLLDRIDFDTINLDISNRKCNKKILLKLDDAVLQEMLGRSWQILKNILICTGTQNLERRHCQEVVRLGLV